MPDIPVVLASLVLEDDELDLLLSIVVGRERSPVSHIACVQFVGLEFSSDLDLNDLELALVGSASVSLVPAYILLSFLCPHILPQVVDPGLVLGGAACDGLVGALGGCYPFEDGTNEGDIDLAGVIRLLLREAKHSVHRRHDGAGELRRVDDDASRLGILGVEDYRAIIVICCLIT